MDLGHFFKTPSRIGRPAAGRRWRSRREDGGDYYQFGRADNIRRWVARGERPQARPTPVASSRGASLPSICFCSPFAHENFNRRLRTEAHTLPLGDVERRQGVTRMRGTREMELMLKGYGLTTAEFLYHMPDHPHVLQTFIWQHYDLAPKFPKLLSFVEFWRSQLDGPLHSVKYTHNRLISATEWRKVDGEILLH
jgi:uncharacterized protein Usg